MLGLHFVVCGGTPKYPSGMSVYLSAVEAPQLTSVELTSFRNGMFELSLQYDQKVCVNM